VRAQKRLLTALIRHTSADPERALPHARTLVRIAPYDEPARAALIRMLVALGHSDQAEQQYQVGLKMLKETGASSSGELYRAWRGAPAPPTASHASHQPPSSIPDLRPASSSVKLAERLVGRDVELGRIVAVLSQVVQQRRSMLVLVSGEPGIGKSTLLRAAAAHARSAGALLLEASAYESESIRPFALWRDALRPLGTDVIASIFGRGNEANRDRLLEGLSELIAEHASKQPVVLMFDDLQWGDESSAAALHYVARTNKEQPLLGVLAARNDELRDNTPVLRAVRELRQAGLLQEIRLGHSRPRRYVN
jgi:hypothetical protein